jgi:hypothetical protein
MSLFVVHTFTSSKRINIFHYHLFHGECEDNESHKPLPTHQIGDDLSKPLVLSRDGWFVPHIFKVSTSLVISSEVKNALGELSNVVYLPVVFKKLVDYPFRAGDFSYFDTLEFRRDPRAADPEKLIKRLPDVPRLHAQVGDYFELVIGNYHFVMEKYANRRQIHYEYPYLGGQEPATLEVTEDMLASYPIMWADGGYVLIEEVFARVREFLDLDYFTVTEVAA